MAKRQRPAAAPAPAYDEVIETGGIRIPLVPGIIPPKLARRMRDNRHEAGRAGLLRDLLQPGDRVLDLGGGIGFSAAIAATAEGVARVLSVEAHPELAPMIAETLRLNGADGADGAEVRNAVIARTGGGHADFFLRSDFWASSMEPDSRPYASKAEVPTLAFATVMKDLRPTVVICDIEGGELDIFSDPALDLAGVRVLMLDLHPKVYGAEGQARIEGVLAAKGFYRDPADDRAAPLQVFRTAPGLVAPIEGSDIPARVTRPWPLKDPRVLIATCMKDEGPFILEWMAWHRALGVTDFVVFTNDCTDGTTEILDRLEDRGEVTHLPNPAMATGSSYFQPAALNYLHRIRALRTADFVIPMDVDEFLNIRTGAGRLADLFAATGPFDALSISELNHGSNGRVEYQRGWIKDQFPAHETETPGKARAWHGVKTITRLSPRVKRIRNHRPHFMEAAKPVLWLDGSGRYQGALQEDPAANGQDVRGSYDLISLEHYPLRALNSYFMKMVRGRAVKADKMVSRRYWRYRNRHSEWTSRYHPGMEAAARAYHRSHYEADDALMALHEAACTRHEARIAEILKMPEIQERRAWIMEEAWNPPAEMPRSLAAE